MCITKEAREVGSIWNAEQKQWVLYFMDQECKQAKKLLNELGQQMSMHSMGLGSSSKMGSDRQSSKNVITDHEQ